MKDRLDPVDLLVLSPKEIVGLAMPELLAAHEIESDGRLFLALSLIRLHEEMVAGYELWDEELRESLLNTNEMWQTIELVRTNPTFSARELQSQAQIRGLRLLDKLQNRQLVDSEKARIMRWDIVRNWWQLLNKNSSKDRKLVEIMGAYGVFSHPKYYAEDLGLGTEFDELMRLYQNPDILINYVLGELTDQVIVDPKHGGKPWYYSPTTISNVKHIYGYCEVIGRLCGEDMGEIGKKMLKERVMNACKIIEYENENTDLCAGLLLGLVVVMENDSVRLENMLEKLVGRGDDGESLQKLKSLDRSVLERVLRLMLKINVDGWEGLVVRYVKEDPYRIDIDLITYGLVRGNSQLLDVVHDFYEKWRNSQRMLYAIAVDEAYDYIYGDYEVRDSSLPVDRRIGAGENKWRNNWMGRMASKEEFVLDERVLYEALYDTRSDQFLRLCNYVSRYGNKQLKEMLMGYVYSELDNQESEVRYWTMALVYGLLAGSER